MRRAPVPARPRTRWRRLAACSPSGEWCFSTPQPNSECPLILPHYTARERFKLKKASRDCRSILGAGLLPAETRPHFERISPSPRRMGSPISPSCPPPTACRKLGALARAQYHPGSHLAVPAMPYSAYRGLPPRRPGPAHPIPRSSHHHRASRHLATFPARPPCFQDSGLGPCPSEAHLPMFPAPVRRLVPGSLAAGTRLAGNGVIRWQALRAWGQTGLVLRPNLTSPARELVRMMFI